MLLGQFASGTDTRLPLRWVRVWDGLGRLAPVTVASMSHHKKSLNACRLLLRLATLAFLTCAVVPRSRAQVLEKAAPNPGLALFTSQPFPVCLLPKPDFQPERIIPEPSPRPPRMSRSQRRAWFLLGLAQHGAAFFDARTTRDAMSHYRELDPLLRPFAHSAAIYPAMQIAPVGLDWLAMRLATGRHRWLRRLWWVPQAAATTGFLWAGMHNLGLPVFTGPPCTDEKLGWTSGRRASACQRFHPRPTRSTDSRSDLGGCCCQTPRER